MPRAHNKVADGLADLAMDRRKSWQKVFDPEANIANCNLIVQSDGGLREGDCAAAAFIIGRWSFESGQKKYDPLMAHGTFLDSTCTVFQAEAIALDEATAAVQRLLRSDCVC